MSTPEKSPARFVTTHRILAEDARAMASVPDASVDLVVTSPPYPMIEMWDGAFAVMNPEVSERLEAGDGSAAFELMHQELDRVWAQCFRVLRPGGLACINIGDATRTIRGDFRLYSNHSRVLRAATLLGFSTLPDILWRKPTNSPNKFLGSGMLPAGAYVTYEHEYVLILRKGPKRAFPSDEDRLRRRMSAFFWEERNSWFSDVWLDLRGAWQDLADPESRERSAAFPFELPWRLILMHSVSGDTVLDPFLGTGTTAVAAAAAGRCSVGLEIDGALRSAACGALRVAPKVGAERTRERVEAHWRFVDERRKAGKSFAHTSLHHGFPVATAQEVDMVLSRPVAIREVEPGLYEVEHTTDRGELEHPRQSELTLPGMS